MSTHVLPKTIRLEQRVHYNAILTQHKRWITEVILTLCQPLHVTASCLKSLGARRLGSIHLKKIWALRLRTLNIPLLTQRSLFRTDTQRGVVTGLSRDRNLCTKIWWFTEFCNSHYVSHFAAFFIVTGTKISIAKSCFLFCIFLSTRERPKRKIQDNVWKRS